MFAKEFMNVNITQADPVVVLAKPIVESVSELIITLARSITDNSTLWEKILTNIVSVTELIIDNLKLLWPPLEEYEPLTTLAETISYMLMRLPEILNALEGRPVYEVDFFVSLGNKIFELIADLPRHLQYKLSQNILMLANELNLQDDLSLAVTIVNRLDTAIMAMKNDSMAGVPPNFLRLLRWYDRYGTTTLRVWLDALFNETLHEFLVENPLPILLNDTRNFFCGPDALRNLSPYFKDRSLQPIQMTLCQINWMMVGPEILQYYTMDIEKNETNIFQALSAGYKITTEVLIGEGVKLYETVLPFYYRAFEYSAINFGIFASKTVSLVQLYLQPYLQGYPPFNNMRGLYEFVTEIYEFVYNMKYLDLDMWPELTSYLVGFLKEFVNVSLRPEDNYWFPQFKYIYDVVVDIIPHGMEIARNIIGYFMSIALCPKPESITFSMEMEISFFNSSMMNLGMPNTTMILPMMMDKTILMMVQEMDMAPMLSGQFVAMAEKLGMSVNLSTMRLQTQIVEMDSFLVVIRTTITMPREQGMQMLQFMMKNHGEEGMNMNMSKSCHQLVRYCINVFGRFFVLK
jgi:hypothetical protein